MSKKTGPLLGENPGASMTDKIVPTGTLKKKREDKLNRRDPRSLENVLKSCQNLSNDEKLEYICEKYGSLFGEYSQISKAYPVLEKSLIILQKEHDHLQADNNKLMLTKAQLESIIREIQKQNKQIRQEANEKCKEEEERRKEVSSKFNEKISNITQIMDDSKDKSTKLRDENVLMAAKLQELVAQFRERENHLDQMAHEMELSKKISDAKLEKVTFELNSERDVWMRERELLQLNLEKSEGTCRTLEQTVNGLKEHIEIYKTQYTDFETTMSKSSKMFDNFKKEMGNASKKTAQLEKELNEWKNRYHGSTVSLLELSEKNIAYENEIKKLFTKINTLQNLCRQLQSDRSAFLKQLNNSGIEPQVPEPKINVPTAKEKELVMLKDNLKALQDQLSKCIIEDGEKQATKIIETKNSAEVTKATAVSMGVTEPTTADVSENIEGIPMITDPKTVNTVPTVEVSKGIQGPTIADVLASVGSPSIVNPDDATDTTEAVNSTGPGKVKTNDTTDQNNEND